MGLEEYGYLLKYMQCDIGCGFKMKNIEILRKLMNKNYNRWCCCFTWIYWIVSVFRGNCLCSSLIFYGFSQDRKLRLEWLRGELNKAIHQCESKHSNLKSKNEQKFTKNFKIIKKRNNNLKIGAKKYN